MGETTWAPTPPGETVGMLQKQIAGYVLMPTDEEVLECALAGIRRAIDRVNTHNWNWALTYDDIPFQTTTADYPLTSWFKAAHNFEFWDTSNISRGRLNYKPWKTFLLEHPRAVASGTPRVYSAPNTFALGSVTLEMAPSAAWIASYPNGRIWYYRYAQYPADPGEKVDVPSPFMGYVQSFAEGYTADRYAVQKAPGAYQRAKEMFDPQAHTGALLMSDNESGTDWGED